MSVQGNQSEDVFFLNLLSFVFVVPMPLSTLSDGLSFVFGVDMPLSTLSDGLPCIGSALALSFLFSFKVSEPALTVGGFCGVREVAGSTELLDSPREGREGGVCCNPNEPFSFFSFSLAA